MHHLALLVGSAGEGTVPGKVFINYRRGDSSGYAGRISDWLRTRFGRDQIFIDVSGIDAGENFIEKLEAQLAQCDAMLSIIGPTWVRATDAGGRRRIDDPNDLVRLEIETALARQTLVIPVLVDEASMPALDALPRGLLPIVSRNAVRIRHESFDQDMEALTTSIQRGSKIATSHEQEEQFLKHLRMQMLSASSAWDIRGYAYELDRYLAGQPHSINARLLKDQFDHVLSNAERMEQPSPTGPPPVSCHPPTMSMLFVPLFIVTILLGVIAYVAYRLFF